MEFLKDTKEIMSVVEQLGKEKQTDMMIEKIGMFLAAWNNYKRECITEEEYVSEIVDVYIMVQQMSYIHKEMFDDLYTKKLDKLRVALHDNNITDDNAGNIGC